MTELVYKKKKLTEEEKKLKRQEHNKVQSERTKKEVKERRKEPTIKIIPAIPLSKVIKMIQKIGIGKVSDKTNIPEEYIRSWVMKVWQPYGKMAETLQEYLKSVKLR